TCASEVLVNRINWTGKAKIDRRRSSMI
ncbi:unnamed protein product, partial [Allacma fusca]